MAAPSGDDPAGFPECAGLTTIRRSCARRSRRCLGCSLGESRPILRHFNVSRRPRGIPEVAHRAPAVTPREEIAERLTVTTTRPCQIGETTTSWMRSDKCRSCRNSRNVSLPDWSYLGVLMACGSVILAKVSESAQHSGRSAAGVTGKSAPPVPRMRRAHPEPRGHARDTSLSSSIGLRAAKVGRPVEILVPAVMFDGGDGWGARPDG